MKIEELRVRAFNRTPLECPTCGTRWSEQEDLIAIAEAAKQIANDSIGTPRVVKERLRELVARLEKS